MCSLVPNRDPAVPRLSRLETGSIDRHAASRKSRLSRNNRLINILGTAVAQISYGHYGRIISVDVDEDGDGVPYWRYTIDGYHWSEHRDTAFKSYELMLGEAKRHAESQADRVPPAE